MDSKIRESVELQGLEFVKHKMGNLCKIFEILTQQERWRALQLLVLIFISSIFDMASLASIMPFMMVLANPELIQSNPWLHRIYTVFEFTNTRSFLVFLGVVFFVFIIVSNAVKALNSWAQNRFVFMSEYSLGQRLMVNYLRQPYEWFLQQHSSDLGKSILMETTHFVQTALLPWTQLITKGVLSVCLLYLMLIVEPILTLCVGGSLGLVYGGIYAKFRQRTQGIGKVRLQTNESRSRVISDAFGGIKEIKLAGLEHVFVQSYGLHAYDYAKVQSEISLIKLLPRHAIEVVAFGGMILVLLYLIQQKNGVQEVLPVVTLLALALYRLIPTLHEVYGSFSSLRFSGACIDKIHHDLTKITETHLPANEVDLLSESLNTIQLKNVSYCYSGATRPLIADLNLEISAHDSIAFVGTTGSGKTTLVDILLGLLRPTQGCLLVNGININTDDRLRAWQHYMGYVPQHIYLIDDTIAANIALGVPKEKIDRAALEEAARIANLHHFVIHDLPMGYDSMIGERGVRLSGGQRQRIGIARALYHKPRVLVMDEATSALDTLTEGVIVDALHSLSRKVTFILIAHRLTTVQKCSKIYLLEGGKIMAVGSYDELLCECETFRNMVYANQHNLPVTNQKNGYIVTPK
jgi:ABC-type bacteriocin/lantibiotic exporter with double-glycine peptidase domain